MSESHFPPERRAEAKSALRSLHGYFAQTCLSDAIVECDRLDAALAAANAEAARLRDALAGVLRLLSQARNMVEEGNGSDEVMNAADDRITKAMRLAREALGCEVSL